MGRARTRLWELICDAFRRTYVSGGMTLDSVFSASKTWIESSAQQLQKIAVPKPTEQQGTPNTHWAVLHALTQTVLEHSMARALLV